MATGSLSQNEYWNGPAAERWITSRAALDRTMASITVALLERAAPRPGERVLDVGCGCGTTTMMLAERVAPGGSVLGVDISAPMIDVARGGGGGGAAAVEFEVGDASTHRFPTRFDLVFSRFGVMFFDDPVAAFRNLRAAMDPDGRMVFVCWRALRDNPWASAPLAAARDLLPPMEQVDPNAPGPFAFADGARLRGILSAAGFAEVAATAHDDHTFMGVSTEEAAEQALKIGPLARAIVGAPDDLRAAVLARALSAVEPYLTADGVVAPAATWLVTARP